VQGGTLAGPLSRRYDFTMRQALNFPTKLFNLLALISFVLPATMRLATASPADPWTPVQTVQAAQFAEELKLVKDPSPVVIYVGVRTLYNGAHIPGAVFHGPGSTEEGISDLKKYAATLPKNSNIVLYCGCCPLEKCPNLRPAFTAIRDMGFAQLRVLILPTDFNTDWVEKGYPIQKGS
jgi:thiosulfate/3-mercaptopyruvate sulfurtransferase